MTYSFMRRAFLPIFLVGVFLTSALPVLASNPGYSCIVPEIPMNECFPPIVYVTIAANPTTIIQGQTSTLTVSSSGSCVITPSAGAGTINGAAVEYTVSPSVTTEYTASCSATNQIGTGYNSGVTTVTVNAATTDLYAGNTTTGGVSLGTPASFSSTVSNGGNSTATNFPSSFQISGIGYVAAQTHTLGSGGSAAISASYNFGSAGNYSVRACADTNTSGTGAYSESDESNNCGAWNTVSVVAPDLTASGLSPTTGTAGVATTITGTVYNSGSGSAGNTTSALRIYNSSGTLIQTTPYVTAGITPGGSAGTSFSYTFPSAGLYSMSMCADWGGVVTESNEANNCGPSTGITIGNPPAPDLTASNLSPTTATVGVQATFQGRVNNIGNATATNIPNIFQICDNNCATVNSVNTASTVASVPGGSNASVTLAYTFGSSGTYYYRMCADTNTSWAGTNAESNEANNCDGWTTITVYAPDLSASVTAPGTVTSGAATTFTGRVYNTGNGSTGAGFSNRWEIDNDAAGAAYATIVDTSAAIPAGADNGTAVSYTIPAGSGGTWFVRLCADLNAGGAGSIVESNESNNCTGWTAFTVAVPDLTAGATSYTAIPESPYVVAGTPFTYNSTVTNAGNATATNFPNSFNIQNIGRFAAQTHTLGAGGSTAISGSYTFSTPGTYNVQACSDTNTSGTGAISESNEANNCGAYLGISVTPAAPTGFTASCNVSGTAMNFSWNASAGSSFYYVRVSKLAAESCPSGWQQPAWSTTTCTPNPDSWGSTSVSNYPITPGNTYYYGAHGALSNGAWGPYGGSVLSCSGAPDLTASTGGATSGTTGVPVTISGTVTNAGNASAGAHSSVIQICGNGTDASCNTVQANAQVAVGALSASQALPVSTQFTFATPGTNGYSYRVCADNWSPTITEANDGNNCSGWSYISISDPGLTASCSVSPTSQQLNQNVTWTASAGGGNGVYTYSWGGTSPLSGTGNPRTVSYSSAGTKTGSVTVTSGAQQTTVACSNSVVVSDPPGATLSSNPTIVTTGSASTLTWSSSGATSCAGTGFNTGGATSGSVSTGALNSTQNYQVSCTGPGGTTNDFETVTVIAPTASIVAQPTLVKSGSGTNLVWSATEVSSCTLSASPAGPSFTSTFSPVTPGQNTTAVTNITKQTDFTLSCTTLSGGNISGSVQVNVRFDSDEF